MEHDIFFEKHTPPDNKALLRDEVPSMQALRRLAWMNPGSSFESIQMYSPCEKKTISSTGEEYVEDVGYGPRKALSDWNGYGTLLARKEQFAAAVASLIFAGEEPQVLDALYERLGHVLSFYGKEQKNGECSNLELLIAGRDAVAATWILATELPALQGASKIVDEAKCKLVSFDLGPRDIEFAKALARLVNYIWNATPIKAKAPRPATLSPNDSHPPISAIASIPIKIEPTTDVRHSKNEVVEVKKIIIGKEKILQFLGVDDNHWDYVRRLSKKQNGPIIVERGEKPLAERLALLKWWNENEKWDKEYDERHPAKSPPLASSNYGRTGSIIHDFAGHVRKAKRSKGT